MALHSELSKDHRGLKFGIQYRQRNSSRQLWIPSSTEEPSSITHSLRGTDRCLLGLDKLLAFYD